MNISAEEREKLIENLSSEVNKREHSKSAPMIKIAVWNFTVGVLMFVKRTIDICASLFALFLFAPIFTVTIIAILIEDGRPIFFSQKRNGLFGKEFDFYKFRSMVKNAEKIKAKLMEENESEDGVIFKMKKDPRITNVGRVIRRFSIDELPQLINVLKGDMSLVGPRPPVPKEVAEYTLKERKRLDVTPGITCLWQVSGRSEIPFKQQVALDIRYIQSRSILNDILLLLKTIPAVLLGKGAY